jgi:hypothetical protein
MRLSHGLSRCARVIATAGAACLIAAGTMSAAVASPASTAWPVLTTTPSAGGRVGTTALNDKATLSGGSSPHGSITFKLYAPNQTCGSGTPAFTQTVPVSGNGTYSTTNSVRTNHAGTWNWTVAYSGDSVNAGASSGCGKEKVFVCPDLPKLYTVPSPGGIVNSVILNDSAKLSGGYAPGGTITFKLYSPSQTCGTGTPAFTQTVKVSGNGTYVTANKVAAGVSGTWNWTAAYSGDANNAAASSGCGKEKVTVVPVLPQGSCEGTGSIGVLVSGSNVVSYVPKGSWEGSQPGIDVVNVEGSSVITTQIGTGSDVINSCASNSVTGITVCTANNNHVYLLKGNGFDLSVTNPLTDGGTGTIPTFSGGSPTTSGVAMDSVNNKALLGISIGGAGGYQFLDLASATFEPPFASKNPNREISEDPLLDPVHHFIGSASEDNGFEITDVTNTAAPKFYEQNLSSKVTAGSELDSTSEDCATGILLAPGEFGRPSGVEIADIQNAGTAPHAVFTPGSPGSWTAPEQYQTLAGSNLSAGASGSAVAQGTHTGVIAGEFGGDGLTALALPTTSGAGATPAIHNWVSCETGPDPAGANFTMGDDPHTLAAYKAPGGDAIALLVNEGATEMVRVDLTAMLNPSAVPATGNVCNSTNLPSSVAHFIPLP